MGPILLNRKQIYSGPIFQVYSDELQTPGGAVLRRDVVEHADAAAVVAVKANGNILFVRQYRHSAGKEVLEIPAGIIDAGETPLACAIRELEEETGFQAANLHFLTSFYTSVGFCNEMVTIYYANELVAGYQHLDEDEYLTVEEYPLDVAISMIADGSLVDAKTVAGLLAYQAFYAKGTAKV